MKIIFVPLKFAISPIKIIFAFSLALLAMLSVFSYKQNRELIKKSQLVNHTNLVRLETLNELSYIKDAETGTRGFLMTGDSLFLIPYNIAFQNIPGSLQNLISLTEDVPKQKANVNKLKELTENRLNALKALINSRISGEALHDSLLKGKELMDEIRAHAAVMVHEEERQLRLRTESLNSAVSFAPLMNILLTSFSLLLLVAAYLKIASELKRINKLRKQLHDSNEVLKKSNEELAQFAYVASHDLQEPLRKIQTFISRINETENTFSEKGRDYFNRIQLSAARMQQLVRDILSYSKISESKNKPELASLNSALNVAVEQLEELIKDKKALINAEKLPEVTIVKYQFEQLFANLLSNALKFCKSDTPAVITITARQVKGNDIADAQADDLLNYHCICISDNGIGFDPEHGERIFQIFNRLHNKEDYEGSGIGLSIVKKIVNTHRGFITATGKKGEGASFSIYLPV